MFALIIKLLKEFLSHLISLQVLRYTRHRPRVNQIGYEPHSSGSSKNKMFPIEWVNRSSGCMQIGPTILETKPKQHELKTSMKKKKKRRKFSED